MPPESKDYYETGDFYIYDNETGEMIGIGKTTDTTFTTTFTSDTDFVSDCNSTGKYRKYEKTLFEKIISFIKKTIVMVFLFFIFICICTGFYIILDTLIHINIFLVLPIFILFVLMMFIGDLD